MVMRTILHIDMDAFYAAVEVLDNPEYQGIPLIIGGTKDSLRGVVATCSYEARRFGVKSAMPLRKAVSLCPSGVFIPGRQKRYLEVSEKLQEVFSAFSPVVEPLSIDEAFLDMTGCEHFYARLEAMGQAIKERVWSEIGLRASVGIAPTKFLAKLASEMEKPDGLVVIRPSEIERLLISLPVKKLWGVGEKTADLLRDLRVFTVYDLRRVELSVLLKTFGVYGQTLYDLARGIDERKVEVTSSVSSIGQETTFDEDYLDFSILSCQIARLVEKVGYRLRKQNLKARTVTLKVRFLDFHTVTKSTTATVPFHDDDTIFSTALRLFSKIKLKPVRLVGVTVSNFHTLETLPLLDSTAEANALYKVLDSINTKFDDTVIRKGRTLDQRKGP